MQAASFDGVGLLVEEESGPRRGGGSHAALGWATAKRYASLLVLALVMFGVGLALGRATKANRNVQVVENPKLEERKPTDPYRDANGRPRSVVGAKAAVAADNGECSSLASRTIQGGGNAVDAAVTATLCQGVRSPFASGVGGGMFAVIRLANGSHYALDAREVAPAKASESMFVAKQTQSGLPSSEVGGLSSGVPLELLGLEAMHARFGKRPWRELVAPIAQLARTGFPAPRVLVEAIRDAIAKNKLDASAKAAFGVSDGAGGFRAPTVNESCCARPAFADALERVAERGANALYAGAAGAKWAEDVRRNGGVMEALDFNAAEVHWREPVRVRLQDGSTYVGMPPPSSGGVVVAAILGQMMLWEQEWHGSNRSRPSASDADFALVEAMMHAYSARMDLGDPGPSPPVYEWQTEAQFQGIRWAVDAVSSPATWSHWRAATRAGGGEALARAAYGKLPDHPPRRRAHALPEDHGTTHVSIADASGLAVALTSTINTEFGAGYICASNGILMNDEVRRRSRRPCAACRAWACSHSPPSQSPADGRLQHPGGVEPLRLCAVAREFHPAVQASAQ